MKWSGESSHQQIFKDLLPKVQELVLAAHADI